MKKQILLLAGSALILASCGSNNNNQQNEQAKMDSIANANKALQDQINQKKNDSTINAMASAKADSIEKADAASKEKEHAGTKTTHTKTTTTTTTKETTPPPPPHNPKDDRFNTNPNGTQKAATVDPNNKKADRFK